MRKSFKRSLEHTISIDEFKVSILIVCLLGTMVACLVGYFKYGEISNNLLQLTETLIFTVGGVNAVNSVVAAVSKKKTDEDVPKPYEEESEK